MASYCEVCQGLFDGAHPHQSSSNTTSPRRCGSNQRASSSSSPQGKTRRSTSAPAGDGRGSSACTGDEGFARTTYNFRRRSTDQNTTSCSVSPHARHRSARAVRAGRDDGQRPRPTSAPPRPRHKSGDEKNIMRSSLSSFSARDDDVVAHPRGGEAPVKDSMDEEEEMGLQEIIQRIRAVVREREDLSAISSTSGGTPRGGGGGAAASTQELRRRLLAATSTRTDRSMLDEPVAEDHSASGMGASPEIDDDDHPTHGGSRPTRHPRGMPFVEAVAALPPSPAAAAATEQDYDDADERDHHQQHKNIRPTTSERRRMEADEATSLSLMHRQWQLKLCELERRQEQRLDELREGLVEVCVAVRKDLNAMEDRLEHRWRQWAAKMEASFMAPHSTSSRRGRNQYGGSHSQWSGSSCCTTEDESSSLRPSHRRPPIEPRAMEEALRHATPQEQRRVVRALLPHLREVIQDELRHVMRVDASSVECSRDLFTQHRSSPTKEAAAALYQCATATTTPTPTTRVGGGVVAGPSPPPTTTTSLPLHLPINFSSEEAFDLHLRAAARAVLAEEDQLRFSTATQREVEHQNGLRRLRDECVASVKEIKDGWQDESKQWWRHERARWMREEIEPLSAEVELLRQELRTQEDGRRSDAAQHERAQIDIFAWLQAERDSRVAHERQLHDRQAELAEHLREELAAWEESAAASLRTCALGPSSGTYATADGIRVDVVQPALEHVHRLLAAHQKMIQAVVDERCTRAEHTSADERRRWDVSLSDLRARQQSLRQSVRDAFGELSQNLNVACPGL